MAWLSLSQTETRTFFDVIHEIECGSPRAVAVVGGAFVEEHLTKVLRWRLVKERIKSNVDLQEEMFRPGGPIGDFGNKIKAIFTLRKQRLLDGGDRTRHADFMVSVDEDRYGEGFGGCRYPVRPFGPFSH